MSNWSMTLRLTLPSTYDPDELADRLREIADQVRENIDPLVGDIWGRDGRLLAESGVGESNG